MAATDPAPRRRRGHGEGGIRRRPDGRWEASIHVGYGPDGKRKRKFVYGRTRADVARRLRDEQQRIDAGAEPTDGRITVAQQLDRWLESRRHADLSPNTMANDDWAAGHIRAAIGHVRLAELTAEHVERALRAKADAGMALSSVRRMHNVLLHALQHAEKRGVVTRNVAAVADVPKCKAPTERKALTPDEARAFLDAAAGERLEALVACALMLGLRPGELTGLQWGDVDFAAGRLSVNRSLKEENGQLRLGSVKRSRAGVRTVTLPDNLGRRLREHRARQAQERLTAGPLWSDHGLVFTTETGTPLDPHNLRRTWRRIAQRAGLDAVVPYQGRHTAATLLLDAGLSIEQVADVLGDQPVTIYRHYRHRTRETVDAAAAPMERLFGDTAAS